MRDVGRDRDRDRDGDREREGRRRQVLCVGVGEESILAKGWN